MDVQDILTNHLQNLVSAWQGPKLCLTITGGSIGLVDILKIPGSSKIINSIEIPYSNESQYILLENINVDIDIANWKSVSPDAVKMFIEASRFKHGDDFLHVSISAALSTMRYDPAANKMSTRRGSNHAYVAISDGRAFHITLDKLTNEETEPLLAFPHMMRKVRHKEDSKIALAVVSILMNNPEIMPKWGDNESCISI